MLTIPIARNYWKITLFMSGTEKTITESHWVVDPAATLTIALSLADDLAQARRSLNGDDSTAISYRVSQENIWRDSEVHSFARQRRTASSIPPTFGSSDTAGKNLKLRANSTNLYYKSIYLGLLPDQFWDGSAWQGHDSSAWDAAWKGYLQTLVPLQTGNTPPASAYGFLALDKTAPDFTLTKLTSITPPLPGDTTLTFRAPSLSAVADDIVKLYFVEAYFPGPNGPIRSNVFSAIYQVESVAGANVTVKIPSNLNLVGYNFKGLGKVKKLSRIVVPYTSLTEVYTGTRKRGARTGEPLGRSRVKRSAV